LFLFMESPDPGPTLSDGDHYPRVALAPATS
jgi:hypothetical protein